MKDIINKIKKDTLNGPDIIIRNIKICENEIYLVFNEVLCSGTYINDFILKRITLIDKSTNLFETIYNNIPSNNIEEITEYNEILNNLLKP